MSRQLGFCAAVSGLLLTAHFANGAANRVEASIQISAASVLGMNVKGENWTVQPIVRSDGYMRLFEVDTPYGDFQVNGQRRMAERLQELRALQTLEAMSRAGAFTDAMGRAGMAPIRFGRDLVLDPVETTGNLISGVGKMLGGIVTTVGNGGKGRDPLLDRVIGITSAERELAYQLRVDPYTDFTPLHKGLEDVARVMAAGGITVGAAISAIPGGAGVAVSYTSTAAGFANSVESKTSDEVEKLVTAKLDGLGVEKATIRKFTDNHFYSPGDEYAIADNLEELNAANTEAFVVIAAAANSADVAKFNRYRAELLAGESAHLGTLKDFLVVSGIAVNHDRAGDLVAAFPFDNVGWTEASSKSLTHLSAESRNEKKRVFATTGGVSPMAQAQLRQLGWTVTVLN